MTKPFTWPLAVSSFGVVDKLRIAAFLFREPMWTYGEWVKRYEDMWVAKLGVKHAVMVSSGSAANELMALRRKWELQSAGEWPLRNKVVFPVNTWISSVSVWINLGFEPVFVDVSVSNLNATAACVSMVLAEDKKRAIGTVFYTALLGFFNDIDECKAITERHGARFMMDNCEASFSHLHDGSSILAFATCSTSIFFSHLTTSGTEGGLIFTGNEAEADWYRMARSHGMTRGMPDKYRNPNVNADFDFYLMGSNYRSSNLQAYMAMLDFDRAYDFSINHRRNLFSLVSDNLNRAVYHRFQPPPHGVVPLAIPILCRTKLERIDKEAQLRGMGMMTRPIIGGSLLAHTAFHGYGSVDDYPVAKWSHENGFYIGLNTHITPRKARNIVRILNAL